VPACAQFFEAVQPDFSTTNDRVATWKGVPFRTARGVVTAETVVNGTIK
jgi:glutamyl-tRNA synthetase